MFRKLPTAFLILLLAAFFVPAQGVVFATPAQAQQADKPKGLLELLFGRNLRKNRQQAPAAAPAKRVRVEQPAQRRTTKRRSTQAAAVAAPPPKLAVEKNEDAANVLVIGDFMASQLAGGLERMFAENPGLIVVDKSVPLSGMVRDDVMNWPEQVASIIAETKPIAVIALVGMNDRQLIRSSAGRLQKLTDPWKAEYQERVTTLARNVREQRVPMIWVGLPPVSKGRMNADYLVFNEYYRNAVESFGGSFVDVWEGYVDDQGRYVRSGPDVNGQIVTLRRADGINMTAAGGEKLAFFTERALKRMTGFGKDALVSSIMSVGLPEGFQQDSYDPVASGRTVVVSLANPVADGGDALEGDEAFFTASDARYASSFDLITKGVAANPKSGRIDAGWGEASFSLPRSETPEPVLANMRGFNLTSFLDQLTPLDDTSDAAPTN